MTEHGTWAYAVTGTLDPSLVAELAGVAGEPVRLVEEQGLTAVAGTVPLNSFGEEALRRNLEDLDWLADVARRHDVIVATVARAVPAVPFRLATVYFDDERVRVLLRERENGFRETLALVAGRAEWGVKAWLHRTRAPVHAGADPATTGVAYLRRKRRQLSQHETIQRHAGVHADEIHRSLATLAVATHLHRAQSPALDGRKLPMILNAAYLVADDTATEFARTVADLAERTSEVEVELTGPWPAYSFVSSGETP